MIRRTEPPLVTPNKCKKQSSYSFTPTISVGGCSLLRRLTTVTTD